MSQASPPFVRAPLAESPWFWAMLFSAFGLALLLSMAPRYNARQRRLEMQYLAHEEMARRRATGDNIARDAGQEGEAAPPASGELMIPLWPLVTAFALLLGVSGAMLWRSRRVPRPARPLAEENTP
jgi:hypothetical protein